MIPAKINIYERILEKKTKTGEKESYTTKQYVIRLKSRDINEDVLNQLNDKDPVVVLTPKEYKDLITVKEDLEHTKSLLGRKFIEFKFQHELEVNKLNNDINSKEKIIEGLKGSNWRNKLNKIRIR